MKKLALNKETLRFLHNGELLQVLGGKPPGPNLFKVSGADLGVYTGCGGIAPLCCEVQGMPVDGGVIIDVTIVGGENRPLPL